MTKHSWIIMLSIVITVLLFAQKAQVRLLDNSNPETPAIWFDKRFAQSTSREIKRERPEIPTKVLATDKEIIYEVQPAIQAAFKKRGFNDDDALEASFVAWKVVRLKSPLPAGKTMNSESFVEFVTTSMGKVVFKSKPDKARVTVGTQPLGPTEVRRWYASGPLNVVFEMDGFESVAKTCEVTAPGFNECEAELKPKQD